MRESAREVGREAFTGESIGQPLSRETGLVLGADAVRKSEGNTDGRVTRECPIDPAWSQTLACADASCAGTGRSHELVGGACQASTDPHREGEEP